MHLRLVAAEQRPDAHHHLGDRRQPARRLSDLIQRTKATSPWMVSQTMGMGIRA